jgi:nucleotide-binding universal stress UspA family protein
VNLSTPFRNILVAVDFSGASLNALAEALALPQRSGGHIRLLHVLDGFPYETVYSGSRAFRLIDDFRARVARVNRRLRSLIPPEALNRAKIDVATVSGVTHDAILAAASEQRADVIVLGRSRRSHLERFVSGSTVQRVLRRATTPVLVVPSSSNPEVRRSLSPIRTHTIASV